MQGLGEISFTSSQLFPLIQIVTGIKELSFAGDPRTPRDREPSIDSNGKIRKTKEDDADWLELPGHTLSSAKTMAVKVQILQWMKDSPDCKILIFTQFLDMLEPSPPPLPDLAD
jgi:hypothetical protein